MNARVLLTTIALLASPMGCGNGERAAVASAPANGDDAGGSTTSVESNAPPPLGEPITAPPSAWTWIDFPETACHNGTPTGIGVWPSATSSKVMIYFMGGGACWDYDSCVVAGSFAHGPFGAGEFDKEISSLGGSIVDHGPNNPFKDWTTIFVPYCTGDLHAGDLVKSYTNGSSSRTIHHKGRANVAAYLARIRATFPSATDVVVTGSSAGGGGSVFNYARVRSYWPNATMFLIDDALPLFVKEDIPQALRQAFFSSWNLDPLTTPICGVNCVDDMSLMFSGLTSLYPNDRMALLSSNRDAVIANAFTISQDQFQAAVGRLATDVLDPRVQFKHFYVGGQSHPLLLNYAAFKSKTVKLGDWLAKMTSGDPSWESSDP